MNNTIRNIVATRNVSRFAGAKLDHWEAGYFTVGSKRRMRRGAKRELARAVRRVPVDAVEDISRVDALDELIEEAIETERFGGE